MRPGEDRWCRQVGPARQPPTRLRVARLHSPTCGPPLSAEPHSRRLLQLAADLARGNPGARRRPRIPLLTHPAHKENRVASFSPSVAPRANSFFFSLLAATKPSSSYPPPASVLGHATVGVLEKGRGASPWHQKGVPGSTWRDWSSGRPQFLTTPHRRRWGRTAPRTGFYSRSGRVFSLPCC
jgi:hypothetical protein